jgi:hypothetical protein
MTGTMAIIIAIIMATIKAIAMVAIKARIICGIKAIIIDMTAIMMDMMVCLLL